MSAINETKPSEQKVIVQMSSVDVPSKMPTHADGACARFIPKFIPMRYLLQLIAFVGFMFTYALRVNLSVAIIVMTKNTHDIATNLTAHPNQCVASPPKPVRTPQEFADAQHFAAIERKQQEDAFDWSESTKSQILAAFYYGYIILQFPGGYFANRFGSHRVFGFAVLMTSSLTLLTPLAAKISPWALFSLRFLMGLFECVSFPAMHVFWSYWAPVPERTRLVGICYCGSQFGTIIAIPLSGVLIAKFGWQSVFYIFGPAGCVWCVIWFIFSAHRPSESRWITAKERDMIEASSDRADSSTKVIQTKTTLVGPSIESGNTQEIVTTKITKLPSVPWLKFARSPAVIALCLAHFAINWALYTFLSELPSYVGNVLKFNITQNGLLSALPFVAMWATQMLTSYSADKLRTWRRWKYSRRNTVIRRTCNAVSLFVPAIFIVCLQFAGCSHVAAVIMLVLVLAFVGISQAGYLVNHVDIASEYAGVLMSCSNTFATIPGFVVPALVALIAGSGSQQTMASWSPFWYISAAIFVVCGLVNCFATSGERLPWMDAYVKGEKSRK